MRSRHATLVGACLLASACGIDVPRTDRPTTSSGSSASDVHDPSVASPRLSFDPALRRMSDSEYRRSVSDLLGVPVPATVQLPPDAETRGFTNQADALDVSGLLFEGYETAAESVVDTLLRRPQINLIVDAPVTEDAVVGGLPGNLYAASVVAPAIGRYRLDLWISGTGAAENVGHAFALAVDDVPIGEQVLTVTPTPQSISFEVELSQGPHRLDLDGMVAGGVPVVGVTVGSAFATGPLVLVPNPARDALVTCDLDGSPSTCVREVLGRLAPRTLRRPLRVGELHRLMRLPDGLLADGQTPDAALGAGLRLLLTHPAFLYRVEPDRGVAVRPLDAWELAARMAALVWVSLPDDGLRAAAESGALLDPEARRAQLARMLADPRASALADVFVTDWLDLDHLDRATPDPSVYPGFDESLRDAMAEELHALASGLVGSGRSVNELLTGTTGQVTPRLAAWYGLPEGTSGVVDLTSVGRGGLLGTAGVLTLTSNPNRSSPTRRGKFILDRLLCSPPSPPPAGVPTLPTSGDPRDLLEAHAHDPFCASCHTAIDPLGFALEAFDGVGARRSGTVSTDATLPDGTVLHGLAGLSRYVVDDPRYLDCVAESLFIWGMGRAPGQDEPTVTSMADAMRTHGGSLDAGIEALVLSDTFAQHRWGK